MFPLDSFEMPLNTKSIPTWRRHRQEWKKPHIIEQMRILITLIFKREAEEKPEVKEIETGIREKNEVTAVCKKPREENILRSKQWSSM